MKLDLLKATAAELTSVLAREGLVCDIYYFFNNVWHALASLKPVSQPINTLLRKAEHDLVAFHASSDKKAWFYIPGASAAISITFHAPPKHKTRQTYRTRIDDTVRHASNAFNVSHNPLTGLLAKDAFRIEVGNEIKSLGNKNPVSASEGQQQKTIAAFAFDIDKFKQVNDTYGHLYGDQVLKAFALRLDDAKSEIQSDYEGTVNVILAHPSGEEFFALIVGTLTRDEINSIAERFRTKIADQHLPNDAEWLLLSNEPGLSKVVPPLIHERKVTSSIGIAGYTGPSTSSSLESEILVLLDKADTALYRSKAAGRNCVTQFDEILQNCGRVLEHDIDNGVVAIDIGSKVGVLVGQEFRVYSPIFSGNTPFTIDDGRSKRTLGIYPKVEICRVVIFNAQPDISFGQLAPSDVGLKKIHSGALLESVPLGNITHLLERPKMLGSLGFLDSNTPQILSGKELQDTVDRLIAAEKAPFAAVFRFKREQEFFSKYGSAAMNRALAQLYSRIRAIFPGIIYAGIIDRTSICLIGESPDFKKDGILEMLMKQYQLEDELEPICGYFLPTQSEKGKDSEKTEASEPPKNIPTKYAIDCARYAVSEDSGFSSEKIQAFSLKIAENILIRHRTKSTFQSAIADYLRFKEFGLNSLTLLNNAGLCYSALKEFTLAMECYKHAVDGTPSNVVVRSNYSTIAYAQDQIDDGLEMLASIKDADLEKLKKQAPHGYVTYSLLLATAKNIESPKFDLQRFKEIGTKAVLMPEAKSRKEFAFLKEILQSVQ